MFKFRDLFISFAVGVILSAVSIGIVMYDDGNNRVAKEKAKCNEALQQNSKTINKLTEYVTQCKNYQQ